MKNNKRQQDLHPFDEMAKRGLGMMREEERLASMARLKKRFDVAYRPKNNRMPIRILSIAATVALLILAGYFLLPTTPKASTFDFTPSALMDVAPLSVVRSVVPPSETILTKAVIDYEQSNFKEAAKSFRAYLKSGGEKKEALLFVGHCELQYAPKSAIETLLEFKATTAELLDANYADLADWYLAWAYYNTEQPDEAIAVLDHLIQNSKRFGEQAQSFKSRIRHVNR